MYQAELTLREGSGYFFVNTSVRGIADVEFQESQGTAEVGLSVRGRGGAHAAVSKQLSEIIQTFISNFSVVSNHSLKNNPYLC